MNLLIICQLLNNITKEKHIWVEILVKSKKQT